MHTDRRMTLYNLLSRNTRRSPSRGVVPSGDVLLRKPLVCVVMLLHRVVLLHSVSW